MRLLLRDSTFRILWRHNCDCLDDPDSGLFIAGFIDLRWHRCGGFLNDTIPAVSRFHCRASWALLRLLNSSSSWRSLNRRGRLPLVLFCLLHCVIFRGGSWRRAFLPAAQELLDIFVVLLAEHASSFLPLKKEIVGRCDVVEPIFLDLLFSFCSVNLMVIDEHTHDFSIDRNRLFSEVDRGRVGWLMLVDGVPGVVANVLDRVALSGVRVEDVSNQVTSLI